MIIVVQYVLTFLQLPATLRSGASEGGDKFFASFNSMNIGSTEPVTSKTVGPKTAASGTGRSLTPRKVSPAGYTIGQAPSPVAASTQQSSVVPGFDPNAYRSAATPCGEPSKGGWARPVSYPALVSSNFMVNDETSNNC